jgi:hypothetical protein
VNLGHVGRRLGQYGAAWALSFLIVLVMALAAHFFLHMNPIPTANALLSVSLMVLSLMVLAAVIGTVMSRESVGAKIAVVVLAVILILPLLWAPVLAVVLAARLERVPIEYSTVYAGFRITVSQLLYPLFRAVFSGAALEWVWNAFQVIASIVGFCASAAQLWLFWRRGSGGRAAPEPAV